MLLIRAAQRKVRTMLHNQENLAPALVDAEQKVAYVDAEPTRFSIVEDSNGYHVGAVSDRYTLIRNADLIGAIDLASDSLGVPLTVERCLYRHGKTSMDFTLPDDFRISGDPSNLKPLIQIGNDYGGGGSLTGRAGVFRMLCTNGLYVGEQTQHNTQRHVGNIDIYDFVYGLVDGLIKRAEINKVIAETTQDMPFEWKAPHQDWHAEALASNAGLLNEIADTTPERYHQPLRTAITGNREEIGHTVWALLQAVSEVGTHNMRGWAAQKWTRNTSNLILEHVGVAVA